MVFPLMAGICLHNVIDGWSTQLAAANSGSLGVGLLVGNLVHKAPESIVLGILLRSAARRSSRAFGLAAFASAFLLLGGALESYSETLHKTALLIGSLAVAGASFLFVGIHMFRAESARTGKLAAAASLAIGFVATAALQQATVHLASL